MRNEPSNLVRSHEREVTLLFGDLRGSTELAASVEMDPLVCEMFGHVMDCLTQAVLDHGGTVVDYYGDGIMAMWGAPLHQPKHADLACHAGLQMLEMLPEVSRDWIGVTQCELRLGIGIHTGPVRLGNAGSRQHVKYGPRGPNVHLASRVEAATKELGVQLLATEATIKQLADKFSTHRVCRAALPGLRRPVDLFAICPPHADTHAAAAWKIYDAALRQFEQGQFSEAAEQLATLLSHVEAIPQRFLAQWIEREIGRNQRRRSTDRPVAHNGVIPLCGK